MTLTGHLPEQTDEDKPMEAPKRPAGQGRHSSADLRPIVLPKRPRGL